MYRKCGYAHPQRASSPAVELGLSNSKLEGLNSKMRLINRRGYGFHSAAAVIAMIYLAVAGFPSSYPQKGDTPGSGLWCPVSS